MTSVLDANVHNIAVEGSFDDCQRIMKTLAADLDFKRRYSLGAVNSVNWARVLAQVVYYFKAVFDVQAATGAAGVRVSVPTGKPPGDYEGSVGISLQVRDGDLVRIDYQRGPMSIRSEDTFLTAYVLFDKQAGQAEGDVV